MRSKGFILVIVVFLLGIVSCQKGTSTSQKPSIIGKWQVIKQDVSYVRNGAVVNSSSRTNYTASDYYQYFADGTGLMSANTPAENGISKFTYTLNGTSLVQFNGGVEQGLSETITSLTDSTLSIHYELQAPDPVTTVIETEKDDYDFRRVAL